MSCKSAIHVYSDSPFTAAITAQTPVVTVPVQNTHRRFGTCLVQAGTGVRAGEGYYDVDVSATLTSAAAGTFSVVLMADGVQVPGAVGTVTLAAGGFAVVAFPAIVRNCCCARNLTVAVTGTAGTTAVVTNLSLVAERL